MTKARTAFAVAILLAVALPLAMVAQTEASPAPPQGQMGDHHMGRMGGPPSPQQHLDHLSKMLNLTDDQKAKIKPILENEATQVQALHQDTTLSMQDRHTKMREIHDTTIGQIRPLLTSDQQAKLDSMKPGMGHDHIRGPKADGQQPPPPPPQ